MIYPDALQTRILSFSLMTPISFFLTKTLYVALETLINKEMNKISNWFKLNKLSLNIDKTNFMIFKNKYSNKSDINMLMLMLLNF